MQAFDGFWLGVIVMLVLLGALLYALIQVVRYAFGTGEFTLGPAWASTTIMILALIGTGVAAYLLYVESSQVAAVCGPVGDCNEVQSSPYARLLGVIPVGLVGLAGYGAILLCWLAMRLGGAGLMRLGWLAIFGLSLFGVLFSIYLTYLELAVIEAVCIWCLTSALLMALILVLSTGPAIAELQGG
jgi:uncharacterized membrane protein